MLLSIYNPTYSHHNTETGLHIVLFRKLVFINLLVSLALDSYIIYKYQGQDLKEKCIVCMW